MFAEKVDFFNVRQHLLIHEIGQHHKITYNYQTADLPMLSFLEQFGATQKSIQVTTKLMQEVPTQSRLCIAVGNTTAYNFINQELLRNCEYFLPTSIEIPSNEKIKVYSFLK